MLKTNATTELTSHLTNLAQHLLLPMTPPNPQRLNLLIIMKNKSTGYEYTDNNQAAANSTLL